MAGVKGKSGGARPNTGGARPGAGRPRKPPAKEAIPPAPASSIDPPEIIAKAPPMPGFPRDPLEFLLDVMQGRIDANADQVRAATAAAQYIHSKKGEGGKKEQAGDRAKRAAGGKFAPSAPPRLVVNNTK